MTLPIIDNDNTIAVSEIFGPTLQGEGETTGWPALFLRFQHCPVQCPGCDTAYSWEKRQTGEKLAFSVVYNRLMELRGQYPGAGLVVTGGEPIIHYQNKHVQDLLVSLSRAFPWMHLETSGYAGTIPESPGHVIDFGIFTGAFSHISVSPKVTPCLHGVQTTEQLLSNVRLFLKQAKRAAFKFVVATDEDIRVVREVDLAYGLSNGGRRVYLMPYGIGAEDIVERSEWLVHYLAKYGYHLSPRLHTIIWGNRRGV